VRVDADHILNRNATALLQSGEAAILGGDLRFDLSAVKRCDSSAVALLLAWQRVAHARGACLELEAVPSSLRSLAELYGVEALISCPPAQSKPAMS
jgi:phospholipid transport system transporter-binding protein